MNSDSQQNQYRLEINNHPIASSHELNELISKNFSKNASISIHLTNTLNKIDIVFIAGLCLLHIQNGYSYRFFYSKPDPKLSPFEIRQYLKQFERLYGISWRNIFIEFQGINKLEESEFIASESFAPIIYIDNNTIGQFFDATPGQEIAPALLELSKKYGDSKLQGTSSREKTYLLSEKSVTRQLSSYSLIHTIVFAILYNKIAPFGKHESKKINNPPERTAELWEFTIQYIRGLHELAKNIVEHSSEKKGMITIRVYTDTDPEHDPGINDKVLETYVFDLGLTGIVQRLMLNTKKAAVNSQIFTEDLEVLEQNFTIKDLIKPTTKTKLNQQLYREIAHYGLMKFYSLIEKNEGVVITSTGGSDQPRDIYTSNKQFAAKAIAAGTSHYFQLPFKHHLFTTKDKLPSIETIQGSAEVISGLSDLLKIEVINDRMPPVENTTGKEDGRNPTMLQYTPGQKIISSRSDEDQFNTALELSLSSLPPLYVAINMEGMTISSSSLLRLLAKRSTNSSSALIIYNLDYRILSEMLEDNITYYKTLIDLQQRVPFWYQDKGVLIFSKHPALDFHFADILYGQNQSEFNTLNHIISHSFPNSNTITNYDPAAISNHDLPAQIKLFFHQSSLLPFDLFLKVNEEQTIFQSNLAYQLNKEMKHE